MTTVAVFSAARTGEDGAFVNAGDELLTQRLVSWLQHERPDGSVVRTLGRSRSRTASTPKPTVLGGDAPETFDPRDLRACVRAIRQADLVVIGGGTLLQVDGADGFVPTGMTRYVATIALLCFVLRTPYQLVGVGVELPARGWSRRRLVSVARHAQRCLVREEEAAAELAAAGVPSEVVGDVYFAPGAARVGTPGSDPAGSPYGVISLRYDLTTEDATHIGELVAAWPAIDRWVIVGMHRAPGHDDLQAVERLAGILPADRQSLVDGTSNPTAVPPLVAGATVAIAMRLHAAYVALDAGTPVRLVGSHAKVRRLAEALQRAEDEAPGHGQDRWTAAERARLEAALCRHVLRRPPNEPQLSRDPLVTAP